VPPRLRIAWLSPTPLPGHGGIRNILRVARHLAAFGHDVHVHFQPCDFGGDAQVAAFATRHYGPSGAAYHCGFGNVAPCDAIVATFWTTAPVAWAFPHARARFYFVQDYEPLFYPPGSPQHAQAEATYRLGLHHICSGPWCAHVIRTRFGGRADHFRFPVDRSVYRPRPRTLPSPHVAFYARPEAAPRRHDLGVAALALVQRRLPETAISCFGSTPARPVPFRCRHLGIVPALHALADLYANADVGLAFSTTNPSLVPLEMMACGCPVVDLDNEINRASYPAEAIRLAAPAPEAVAEAIVSLLQDAEARRRQRQAALAFVRTFPGEEEVGRQVEASILRGVLGS
jgi:glycosyltransferase involved in cell wall biosynthesis